MRPRCAIAITTSRAPAARRALDRRLEHRHERVVPLDREALVALIRAAEEALEPIHFGEPAKHGALLLIRERAAHLAILDHATEPRALGIALDVLELEADRGRVDAAQAGDRIGRGRVGIEARAPSRESWRDRPRLSRGIRLAARRRRPAACLADRAERPRWPYWRMACTRAAAPAILRRYAGSAVDGAAPPRSCAAMAKNCRQDSSTEPGSRSKRSCISATYPSLNAEMIGRSVMAVM